MIREPTRLASDAWWGLLPLLIVGALFSPGFGGFWLGDDIANLHQAHAWSADGVLWRETWRKLASPVDAVGAFYRPVMIASLSLNYALAGTHYAGWFAVNLGVHLANLLLVWLVVRRLARWCGADAGIAAALAATWFGAFPLLVEGVSWISARADGWVTLLCLAGLWFWAGRPEARSPFAAWMLPLLLVPALGFKESAAVLPLQMLLVALAWPARNGRSHWLAVGGCFALVATFLAWRAHLFGSAWQVYRTAGHADPLAAIGSIPAWWAGATATAATAAGVGLGAAMVALVLVLAPVRGAPTRLTLALLGAAGGLAVATLLNLGALSPTGEGGRLAYGPVAWAATALGVALARQPTTLVQPRLRMRGAAVIALAIAAVAGIVATFARVQATRDVQDGVRMLASAIPDWADRHPGLTLLVVPGAVGAVVAPRNAQGGLALPPIQRQGLLHRVLPSLPADLPARHDQLATGLATRLDVVRPERVDGSVLASLLHPADPVWPARLACWSGRERRIVELPSADWTDRQRWLERVGASMMRC